MEQFTYVKNQVNTSERPHEISPLFIEDNRTCPKLNLKCWFTKENMLQSFVNLTKDYNVNN